jgi:hypothetical protein
VTSGSSAGPPSPASRTPPLEESALAVAATERARRYEADRDEGGFCFGFGSCGDLIVDEKTYETAVEFVREKISVHDPDVARRLTPDYPLATKRLPLFAFSDVHPGQRRTGLAAGALSSRSSRRASQPNPASPRSVDPGDRFRRDHPGSCLG